MTSKIDIDSLISIISRGGKATTGVNLYNSKKTLLLDKDYVITNIAILEKIKQNGIQKIPLSQDAKSGIWDAEGNVIYSAEKVAASYFPEFSLSSIEKRLNEIQEVKKMAEENYETAKQCIKQAISDIKATGGEFDYTDVSAHVFHLTDFLFAMKNPFSYMTKEIFSFDDYLFNHSINVCTIGTTIMHRFNEMFSEIVSTHLKSMNHQLLGSLDETGARPGTDYVHFQKDELQNIALGFFLHDIGKVLVPPAILNKTGTLTPQEFETIKRHSHDYGLSILEKNRLNNPFITNIVMYHHAPLYEDENRCYPPDRSHTEIPVYTKVCKLSDIYDAMTSKRSYKEAVNKINAVTEIFRSYAKKDTMLQYILRSFIKSIGIYPPGSIVYLRNGQMAYVLESEGPFVLPFTDHRGGCLSRSAEPIDLSEKGIDGSLQVDNRKSVKEPKDVYDLLPSYLKPESETRETAQPN